MLQAISPVDGRYESKTKKLVPYFSEYALIRHRLIVEIEYYIALSKYKLKELPPFKPKQQEKLRSIYLSFSLTDAERIKEIEKKTNHDVKAVEYFLKEKIELLGFEQSLEFIHFGLTSQDINNTAIPLSLKHALKDIYYPALEELIEKLQSLAIQWKSIPMLARTHGQPASPTTLGKELYVFVERLYAQKFSVSFIALSAKCGGATGNLNAHVVAYPDHNWEKFMNHFVEEILGLSRTRHTTQIEHYDNLAALFDGLKRINTILIDLCRDVWTYISMDYFKQKINKDEVGSSAMPHKVNPIDFENAEGNAGIAIALFEHMSAKLPISRLQRDLTDSTVLRNIGVPFAHTLIAFDSLMKGLNKIILNEKALHHDLDNNWAVVAEAIQTILRREGYPKPYEALKTLTRGNQKIDSKMLHRFIDKLDISQKIKKELKAITPFNYTGVGL